MNIRFIKSNNNWRKLTADSGLVPYIKESSPNILILRWLLLSEQPSFTSFIVFTSAFCSRSFFVDGFICFQISVISNHILHPVIVFSYPVWVFHFVFGREYWICIKLFCKWDMFADLIQISFDLAHKEKIKHIFFDFYKRILLLILVHIIFVVYLIFFESNIWK